MCLSREEDKETVTRASFRGFVVVVNGHWVFVDGCSLFSTCICECLGISE